MKKTASTLLTAFALTLGTIIPASAEDFNLRKRAMVIDDKVTMGDVFDNAGQHADLVLFDAPQPGERVLFTMRDVRHALNSNGIEWNERLSRKHVIVERTGMKIPLPEILEVIEQRMLDEGLDDSVRVHPRNRHLAVHVPVEGYNRIEIETFELDEQTGRLSAQMMVSAPSMTDKRFKVDGRVIYVTEIPTLNTHKKKTDVISERDIQWISIETRKLRDGFVMDVDELLGMSPTRSIRPGKPIRRQDVRLPITIEKGEEVLITFDMPGLSLTAKGEALDDGASKQVIRVKNLQSNQTVSAKVIRPGHVVVDAGLKTAWNQ